MSVDLETVTLMSTYRVGYLPPEMNSLAPGELYVEAAPPGGGPPRLWVGAPSHVGLAGDVALLAPAPADTSGTVIAIDPVDNPSPSNAVHISGTVTPGTEIELAAIQGSDQVNTWSPWDASAGSFDITWYLPPGDNYFIRARLRANPENYADSGLFAVEP